MAKLDSLVNYIINTDGINRCMFCYATPSSKACRRTIEKGCEDCIKYSLKCMFYESEGEK